MDTPAPARWHRLQVVRTHRGHVFTAAALNFLRRGRWFTDLPRAKTRRAPFAKLMAESVTA